ncbi:MAG: CARDB domain-containing protein [Nitrospiraceae bacterium]
MFTFSNDHRKEDCPCVRITLILLLAWAADSLFSASAFAQVGLMPIPTLQGVQVQAETTFDPGTQRYTYRYTVSNPAGNTGQIWHVEVDVTTQIPRSSAPVFNSSGLTIPHGGIGLEPFDQELADLQPLALPAGTTVVPFGQQVSTGWNGGLMRNGFASFSSSGPAVRILPGQTLTGFALIGPGMPTIRKMEVLPFWTYVVPDVHVTNDDEEVAAAQVEEDIIFHTFTLGPSAHTPGTFAHWDQVRDDLNQAIQLGWIPDATLANALVTQLASARQALDAQDGTLAKTRLQTLIQTINQSTPAQRRPEVAGLVVLNAQRLVQSTPDTPIPFEPKLKLTPQSSTQPIGTLYTLTAMVTNLGDPVNPPIPGFELEFEVAEGPQAGLRFSSVTDAQGKLEFGYTGTRPGTDRIKVEKYGEVPTELGSVDVTWAGGPDLAVPLFAPPLLMSQGGNTVFVTEWTSNIGTVASPPSLTRYFLSPDTTVDPLTARVIGERAIPALAAGERSEGAETTLTLPSDLPAGTYRLAACADAAGTVVELNEQNNCSFSKLVGQLTIVLALEREANNPPLCSQAVPSTARLWPPNHKLVTIAIQGVTDPDNDPITIRVTGITQDEPVNGLGDGDTSPDGFGVSTAQAQVRKERSGAGNGRVYAIAFTADDGKGGTCTGSVSVGVPHDQGQGSVPIDDGQNFDSTKP